MSRTHENQLLRQTGIGSLSETNEERHHLNKIFTLIVRAQGQSLDFFTIFRRRYEIPSHDETVDFHLMQLEVLELFPVYSPRTLCSFDQAIGSLRYTLPCTMRIPL